MSGTLQPGDLCVIIDGRMRPRDRCYIGRTVVLLEVVPVLVDVLSPYWRCAGLPPLIVVSHLILRKIPPESMIDARSHLEPVNTEEEVLV